MDATGSNALTNSLASVGARIRKDDLAQHRKDIQDRRASLSKHSQSMPDLHPTSKSKKKTFDFGMSWISTQERRRHQSPGGARRSTGELGRAHPREGAVRDIHCLGIIAEKIILAFKGKGSLKVYLQDVQNDGLEGQDICWEEVYDKHLAGSRMYRFMEFEMPQHLPATIVVIGESVHLTRPCKVTTEARLRARVSCCGQVISSVSHLAS